MAEPTKYKYSELAASMFRGNGHSPAIRNAMDWLDKRNPRGCYELGMKCYHQGDFINAVLWSELCLTEVPDWPYSFLAMHSIAASYHKAGLLQMADHWARKSVSTAPFFEPPRSFIIVRNVRT